MAESVVGRGVIELVADARRLKAGIEDAKKSIRTLGEGQKDISKSAAQSIDRYIGKLQQQNVLVGKSVREQDLFKLALRGASNEQLKTADAALRMKESHEKLVTSVGAVKTAFVALGAIAATGLIAAAVAFDRLVKNAGDFQDFAEKVGDTAANFSSLAIAAAVGGTSMDAVVGASTKLSKALTGVDDDSKAAGAAVEALGLNLKSFKQLGATDQIEAVAKAMAGFEDGTGKTAVAMALFGKAGAEMLPFLKELAGDTGRVNILTSEQIRLADEYSDKQKRLTAEIGLHAQAIAVQMLPAYNDLIGAFLDVIKGISGVESGANGLRNNTSIQDFAESAVRSLAFVADSANGVVTAFQLVGKAIAANLAIREAVLKGEIRQALAINDAAREDIGRLLAAPTFGSKLDQRIAERKDFVGPPAPTTPQGRPKLKFSGAVAKDKSGADTAAQEAKARLAFDLEQIRKASEATINTFSNAEKVMQALRSAGIANDKEYFDAKRVFIQANSDEQEAALQKEIARLQQEVFVGKTAAKERLDNDRKIADVQAKIAKIRADASTDIIINNIAEAASAQKLADETKKIAQAYVDAKVSADAYIESITRRNKLELEGIGRGTQFREIQQGRIAIEEKFTASRIALERDFRNELIKRDVFDAYLKMAQDTFSREVILYDERTEALLRSQGNWINGATEALNNYIDESRNIAKQTEDLFTNAFKGAEDALVEFTKTGKLNFKDFVTSILAEINRMTIKQNILGPLAEAAKTSGLGDILGLGKKTAGAAAGGADGAALSASIATAGASFSTAVTAAGTTAAATFGTGVTTAATAFGAGVTAAEVSLAAGIIGAGATFAAEVTAAGAAFAAATSASSAASGVGGLSDILGSFDSGINFVPKTGLAVLHKGERVLTAEQNKAGGWSGNINISVNVLPGATTRTANQAAKGMGQEVQRVLSRLA